MLLHLLHQKAPDNHDSEGPRVNQESKENSCMKEKKPQVYK